MRRWGEEEDEDEEKKEKQCNSPPKIPHSPLITPIPRGAVFPQKLA